MPEIPLVRDVLITRALTGDLNDGWKVALLVEGGAMRGVVGAGMVTALCALDFLKLFNRIDLTSAAACSLMYAQAGLPALGTSIYYQDLTTRFIDRGRLAKGQPLVDIEFLTHNVMLRRKPFDFEKVRDFPVPTNIYVSSAKDMQVRVFSKFASKLYLHDVLHWTCRMPVAAGLPIRIGNDYFTDGAVIGSGLPLKPAIEDGFTHILVLQTKPEGTHSIKRTFSDHLVRLGLYAGGFAELANHYFDGFDIYDESLKLIKDRRNAEKPPLIDSIQPSGKEIDRLETGAVILRNGAVDGFDAVMKYFNPIENKLSVNESIQII